MSKIMVIDDSNSMRGLIKQALISRQRDRHRDLDDGRGLDYPRILAIARQRGLIAANLVVVNRARDAATTYAPFDGLSYVAATGATSVAFDTDLPGYDPAWRTDITLPWGRSVRLTHSDGSDTVSLFHDEALEQPQELQSRATVSSWRPSFDNYRVKN
jgi:hypothetical protein